MRYAIVGSRRRTDRNTVNSIVATLRPDDVVISGGCRGVDSWAVDAARQRGLRVQVITPNLGGCVQRWQFTKAYYARNALVAAACDVLIALPATDRTGGTENTIAHAKTLGKQIVLH